MEAYTMYYAPACVRREAEVVAGLGRHQLLLLPALTQPVQRQDVLSLRPAVNEVAELQI